MYPKHDYVRTPRNPYRGRTTTETAQGGDAGAGTHVQAHMLARIVVKICSTGLAVAEEPYQ
jgi:hypothetical protein